MRPGSTKSGRLGTVLNGRYRLDAVLAQGAMGVVYRGERLGLGRPVAIKFLVEGQAPERERRRRFEIEARAASRMSHPNCVPVIDYGVEDDTPFLVMELVPGETLRTLLFDGPLPVPRALRLARQILAGLSHAHGHGIVHRDLKPENILVWSDGLGEHLQITDFGLAKLEGCDITWRTAVGTPGYMSPEQTLGDPVDARADVYAAGILLFELLTGDKLFWGVSPFETMRLHREAPVPSFDEVAADRMLSPALEHVVRRALEKQRDDRYPSAIQLANALDDAMVADLEQSEEIELAPRSSGVWWKLVGVLAAASVATTIWLLQ